MPPLPVVLIHGYSDKGTSFQNWVNKLRKRGYDIRTCSYKTLTNEVTIQDIAEGLDRALCEEIGLNSDEDFDVIVHSTGMLVIRSWLTAYAKRKSRLKHLICLAPASFGSPLAHKGRSWLGGIFKGNKEWGPDFLEAGNRILDGLELGSRFTWDLAEKDLLGEVPYYGPKKDTPYVFSFCGTEGYDGIRMLLNENGTDGTVRWAGCALNTRKIFLDLTKNIDEENNRILIPDWSNIDIPLIPIKGANHRLILVDPPDELVDMVHDALSVETEQSLNEWYNNAISHTQKVKDELTKWQQFVFRATDERGDPITDYYVQLEGRRKNGKTENLQEFMDVHIYSSDPSLRNFHVNLSDLKPESLQSLSLNLIACTGTSLVSYNGFGASNFGETEANEYENLGTWHATIDLTNLLRNSNIKFFYPFTTTLVELRLNREPLPLKGFNKVCWFEK